MKKYLVIKLDDQTEFNYLVISLTYESILSFIDELLKEIDGDSNILFDTLLTNAEKTNRYVKVSVINGKIDRTKFKNVDSSLISQNIVNLSCKYFFSNKSVLNNGVLTTSQKEKFFNKCKRLYMK